MLTFWPNWWEDWQLYHKVTFDGINKLIICNPGETEILVKEDIYSAWKEWVLLRDNAKFLEAIRVVGGDPITNIISLGATFFLRNGWKIRPAEADYNLNVVGNLYTDDGSLPFVDTIAQHNVKITIARSNLIDTVQLGGTSATDIWSHNLEGLYSAQEIMRIMAAALAGKISGADTGNIKIRDLGDTKDRITADTDIHGNRLSVTLDEG
jgi:hypothetical protein